MMLNLWYPMLFHFYWSNGEHDWAEQWSNQMFSTIIDHLVKHWNGEVKIREDNRSNNSQNLTVLIDSIQMQSTKHMYITIITKGDNTSNRRNFQIFFVTATNSSGHGMGMKVGIGSIWTKTEYLSVLQNYYSFTISNVFPLWIFPKTMHFNVLRSFVYTIFALISRNWCVASLIKKFISLDFNLHMHTSINL